MSGVHFGHQTRGGIQNGPLYLYFTQVHIIDLLQTAQLMEDAYKYVRSAAEQGKSSCLSALSAKLQEL